jgi:diaminohydroxyphosphoribosylaminopyrimidine deaminase/5-amino-6-(5-phosphoribosylamino)uracil reductase
MQQALALAEQARFACPPNPAVGCVLVGADGAAIGRGYTQPVGQAHAEVMALRDAARNGHATQGATAYDTLEPCAHPGNTGPCCDALIAAGVARVVAALEDPNPLVAGRGFARLHAAGVSVDVGPGAVAARDLNAGFFKRMECGLPWVRVKVACSLDGRTALPNGASQWITSPEARADGQLWRARASVILTGIGTVLRDDPRLNVRVAGVARQPALAIMDSRLRTPPDARLWRVPGRSVLVYTASADAARQSALRDRGAEVLALPAADGRVDPAAVLRDLARREMNEVHLEAGATLAGAFWRAGLADELLLYQAPVLLGDGAGVVALDPIERLDEGLWLDVVATDRVGPDLRLRARPRRSRPAADSADAPPGVSPPSADRA